MTDNYDINSNYNYLFYTIRKLSSFESFLIIKKLYFTDNVFYYFLCLIFRFIPLFILSGNYSTFFKKNKKSKTIYQYLKTLTCHNIINQFKISIKVYLLIHVFLFVLFIIKIIINVFLIIKIDNNKYLNKRPSPNKYKIILDHFIFLFFPYIIEYLSFSYYIYLFPDKFIININNKTNYNSYIFIILSTFLIVGYNIDNYLGMISSNKMNIITIFDAYLRITSGKNNKHIAYRISNLALYILIFLQNFTIVLTLENYLNFKTLTYFKIIISIIILLAIIIFIFSTINEYNYTNIINIFIYIFIFFCFYSIIIDFIIYLLKYKLNNNITNLIYIIFKLYISYITYMFVKIKTHKILGSKVIQILFEEKNKEQSFQYIESLYYFHNVMVEIKDKKHIYSVLLLIKFLNNHINICRKLVCNCKLLKPFVQNIIINKNDNEEVNSYIDKLLDILSYLFEGIFIELNYFDKYDLSILLSEHFCHLKNNPTMSFSFINTLIISQRRRFSKFQIVSLYEFSQKYVNFLIAKIKYDTERGINCEYKESLIKNIKIDELINSYANLIFFRLIKKLLINYIDNEIKILKYKNIFIDSIIFQYDENNEVIISVKILFFNQKTRIENLYDNKAKYKKKDEDVTNLQAISFLLKKENIYHMELSNFINQMDINQNIPVFLVFKLYIFFDIFGRHILPNYLNSKLNLMNKSNLYNSDKSSNESEILIKRFNEMNNQLNSKHFAIFEYKKELRTKYYCEDCALKLGYKQKDIINKEIDELMPKEFSKSHQKLIKESIIYNQIRYFNLINNYFFDFSSTVLYSVNYIVKIVFSFSKYLNILIEWEFNIDNEYQFMLNNNFQIIAISKNFELEYFLNQKIFQIYNIKLTDILGIMPEEINKNFNTEIKNIKHQKFKRQAKTEEYFMPKLYPNPEEKGSGMVNSAYFNISKNNIISKLHNFANNEEKEYIKENENKDIFEYTEKEEKKKFIAKNNFQKVVTDLFIKRVENIVHKTYKKSLNKTKFIKNLAIELSKIEEHSLNYEDENNKKNNLLISAKKLISQLLKRKDLSSNVLSVIIKYSYYYDKSFYFITINDQKKLSLNISNEINYNNQQITKKKKLSNVTPSLSQKRLIQSNKNDNDIKPRNKIMSDNNNSTIKNQNKVNARKKSKDEVLNNDDKNEILNKINLYRQKINKDKLILIIRCILYFIIVVVLILYIVIIIYLDKIININEKILFTYFYNIHTRDFILNLYDKMHQIFYDHTNLSINPLSGLDEYQYEFYTYSVLLKNYYHNFTSYFFDYNLAIGHNFNIIYKKRKFFKLRGYFKQFEYFSDYTSEINFMLYYFLNIKMSKGVGERFYEERRNFFFFKEVKDIRMKSPSSMIKLYYYLCTNYEFSYKSMFNEIEQTIIDSYQKYNNFYFVLYYIFEIFAVFFFIAFYLIVYFFLYYSNEIIIKNIIFLFLDFDEDLNNTNNIINLKLLELKYLFEDFDINRFKKYSQNIDDINKNKKINSLSKELIENYTNINSETTQIYENIKEQKMILLNKNIITKKTTKNIKIESNKLLGKKTSKNITEQNHDLYNKNNNNINNNKYNIKIDDSIKNHLIERNSQLLRDKMHNGSLSVSNGLLINNNISNSLLNINVINKNNKDSNDNNIDNKNNMIYKKKSFESNKSENNENIQDILLNESKQNKIFLIQFYIMIIFIFTLIVILFTILKFLLNIKYKKGIDDFFLIYSVITGRYNLVYYFFNTFRTLLIYPEGERKEKFKEIMENIMEYYEFEEKNYINIIQNKISDYKELKELIDVLKLGKKGCLDIIKEKICLNDDFCLNYLNSNYHIFSTGVDSAYHTCIDQLKNLYMDYKKIKNKIDINEINSTIIIGQNSPFFSIGLSLGYLFYYVKERIFECFKYDESNFIKKYRSYFTILNLTSIILSIISFLFINIFIIISLYKFTKPIKEAVYRINCSFYNIKQYGLNNYK